MFACVIVLRARPDPFAISSRLPPVSGGGGDGGGGGGGGGDASITSFGRSDFCISILTGRKCQGGSRVAAQFMGETPRGGKPGEETKGGGTGEPWGHRLGICPQRRAGRVQSAAGHSQITPPRVEATAGSCSSPVAAEPD